MIDMTGIEMNTRGVIGLVIAIILPIVVGLVTKQSWSPGLKAVILLFLTAITQALVSWQDTADGEVFHWQPVVWSIGLSFVVSVAVHFGLWKPTGASEAAQNTGVHDEPVTRTR